MILPFASVEDLEFVQRRTYGGIMNYQFSKKMSYLLTPPTTNEILAFFQPEKRRYPFEALLFSTRLNWRAQSWVEKRRLCNALFYHEKDPEMHSVELLCNTIHEKNIPSWYEDSLRALSFILVAGMHNSGLIRYLDPHKASFDECRHAVQTARTRYTQKRSKKSGSRRQPMGEQWRTQALHRSLQVCYGKNL
jgi:hypothetical protein